MPHPPSLDDYDRKALRIIAERGWMVQWIAPHAGCIESPFAYTVGLTAAGLPELVVTGSLPLETFSLILNTAAKQSLAAEFAAGQTLTEVVNVPLRVFDAPLAPVNMAHHLYGATKPVRALQLVWPDEHGTWPWEPDWRKNIHQPIYGDLPQAG